MTEQNKVAVVVLVDRKLADKFSVNKLDLQKTCQEFMEEEGRDSLIEELEDADIDVEDLIEPAPYREVTQPWSQPGHFDGNTKPAPDRSMNRTVQNGWGRNRA